MGLSVLCREKLLGFSLRARFIQIPLVVHSRILTGRRLLGVETWLPHNALVSVNDG